MYYLNHLYGVTMYLLLQHVSKDEWAVGSLIVMGVEFGIIGHGMGL